MGEVEVEAFLTYLAVERKVSASTQNQAFRAKQSTYLPLLKATDPNGCPLPSIANIRIPIDYGFGNRFFPLVTASKTPTPKFGTATIRYHLPESGLPSKNSPPRRMNSPNPSTSLKINPRNR